MKIINKEYNDYVNNYNKKEILNMILENDGNLYVTDYTNRVYINYISNASILEIYLKYKKKFVLIISDSDEEALYIHLIPKKYFNLFTCSMTENGIMNILKKNNYNEDWDITERIYLRENNLNRKYILFSQKVCLKILDKNDYKRAIRYFYDDNVLHIYKSFFERKLGTEKFQQIITEIKFRDI